MRLIFIGPPGAGKGTQAVRLAARLKIPHLSTGDLLRAASDEGTEIGREVAKYMLAGKLAPDLMVLEVLAERLKRDDCREGYVLDGFPRTLPQAEAFDRMLAEAGQPLTMVIEIRVAEDRLLERLAARGRADDHAGVIRERLCQYDQLTRPLLDYYRRRGLLEVVDGHGTPDEVSARIVAAVERGAEPKATTEKS